MWHWPADQWSELVLTWVVRVYMRDSLNKIWMLASIITHSCLLPWLTSAWLRGLGGISDYINLVSPSLPAPVSGGQEQREKYPRKISACRKYKQLQTILSEPLAWNGVHFVSLVGHGDVVLASHWSWWSCPDCWGFFRDNNFCGVRFLVLIFVSRQFYADKKWRQPGSELFHQTLIAQWLGEELRASDC